MARCARCAGLSRPLCGREPKIKAVVVPEANAREAAVVEGIDVFAVRNLPQAVDLVNVPESFVAGARGRKHHAEADAAQYAVDMRDVRGQGAAKRALEVACAGGHGLFYYRAARRGKNDARQAHPHNLAADVA